MRPSCLAGSPVLDMHGICSARDNFQDLSANNNGDRPDSERIGRPSLTETSDAREITGFAAINLRGPNAQAREGDGDHSP
jgi:hypothetical protein